MLLALGTWQVRRLAWKTDLIVAIETRGAAAPLTVEAALADSVGSEFRHASAKGRYRHDLAIAMGTVAEAGEVGARLVTPLQLADGRLLLVERGWLPERLLPPAVPADMEPAGDVKVDGVVRWHDGDRAGLFTPANQPQRRRWFWYDMPALAAELGGRLEPLVLVADGPGGRGLPHLLPVRADLPNNHLGYAITWYGLAAALLAVYVAFGLRRGGE